MKAVHNILKVCLLMLIVIFNVSVNTYGEENKVKLIGHRGASALEPENTIPSFNKAANVGAWGIEADIYVLRDGNIVANMVKEEFDGFGCTNFFHGSVRVFKSQTFKSKSKS